MQLKWMPRAAHTFKPMHTSLHAESAARWLRLDAPLRPENYMQNLCHMVSTSTSSIDEQVFEKTYDASSEVAIKNDATATSIWVYCYKNSSKKQALAYLARTSRTTKVKLLRS